jgi:hypothetical protein
MPPLDGLQKNTIDINGLATLVQQYMTYMVIYRYMSTNPTHQTSPAQMNLITQSGNIVLSYSSSISLNSEGVTVYMQVLEENNSWTFQYYYVGFDTTNSSYTTSELELYVSAYIYSYNGNFYTNTVRIAYTNASFTKTSDSYLFIVWLIEFQNIPSYLVYFTPILQNNEGIESSMILPNTNNKIYFDNGSCNFSCGGNCPSTSLSGFITYVQNNSVILEFPLTAPLGTGVSNLQVLICTSTGFQHLPTISGSTSATLTPPISGATFYVAIATITVTYQGS